MGGSPPSHRSSFSAALGDWRRALDDRGSGPGRELQRLYGEEAEAWRAPLPGGPLPLRPALSPKAARDAGW